MPPLRIALSRCSVSAADDVDAPHSRIVTVPDGLPLRLFVQMVADSDYLPRISGGRATWGLELRATVAVLAQQWRHTRFLSNPETPMRSMFTDGRPVAAHLRYLA
jgi:hypothetical protein